MNGITFDNYHSYDDFGIILSSKTIGSPTVKENSLNVPGADGKLDLTDFFGQPRFNTRKLTLNFTIIGDNQLYIYSLFKNSVHGRRMKIVLHDDPEFYYFGRIAVGDYLENKGIGTVTIICDCDPWKLKFEETRVSKTVNRGSRSIVTLRNSRKPVSPTITVTTGNASITFGSTTFTLSVGENQVVPEFVLSEGDNEVIVESMGNTSTNVTFVYREGGF